MAIRVGIVGVAGRMGAELVRAVCSNPDATLAAAIARPGSAALGQDAGVLSGRQPAHVAVTADLKAALPSIDVVIDFSRAEAVAATAQACTDAGVALMIGTTGLSVDTQQRIDAAAQKIP